MGSGNVLKFQQLFQKCVDHVDEKESEFQAVSVLGMALIASSEEIGTEMAFRAMNHILQYGDITLKRAVPLGLALLSLSHPRITLIDTLSKLSHDPDSELSQRAILSLGLIGAGTNNSRFIFRTPTFIVLRIADLFKQLSSFHLRDTTNVNHLFIVRLAQGFLHMGKVCTFSFFPCRNYCSFF